MRICSHLTCDKPADVWWHGAWCGFHADQRFGAVIGTLSNLQRAEGGAAVGRLAPAGDSTAQLEAHGSVAGAPSASHLGTSATRQAEAVARPTRPQGAPSSVAPVLGGQASPLGSLDGAEPAPLYDDQLVALLDEHGWDLLDAELACITALGEDA